MNQTYEVVETAAADDKPSELDDLNKVLTELGNVENSTIKVERYRQGKSLQFVDDYAADTFSLKLLQTDHGGGDYRIIGRTKGMYRFRRDVSISNPVARPETGANNQTDLLSAIHESFKQQTERFMQMFMMQKSNENPGTDRTQLLEEIRMIKEIFTDGTQRNDQTSGAEKGIELIKMGIDFAKDMDGSGKTTNMDVLLKGMETFSAPLASAIEINNEQKRADIAAAKSKPNHTQVPHAQPQRAQEDMRIKVAFLIQQAKSNADPSAIAEVILSYVTPEQLNYFLANDPLKALAKTDQRVLEHAEWFGQLAEEIKLLIADDESNVSENRGATAADMPPG